MQKSYAEKYSDYEENHWWFRARRDILKTVLSREVRWRPGTNVLEIGVASGCNLYSLYPSGCRLHGLEPDAANAAVASRRGSIPVGVGTVEKMPPEIQQQTFEVITMFDVLEHIEHDLAALQLVRQRLTDGGVLVLTVPAYQWMWGQQDVVNLHFRRYTRPQLVARLKEAGYQVRRATYFNTLLFPPIALVRLLAGMFSSKQRQPRSDFEYSSGGMDRVLYRLFASEAAWLGRHSFPFGVSILAVADNVLAGRTKS